MCGIIGYLSFEPRSIEQAWQKFGMKLLSHRGPDDEGEWADEFVWLAHKRLSIQDLSVAGSQPMLSKCGRFIIVFNGEIYNHLELRAKYLSDRKFSGHSDTETLIELFALLRDKMQYELVGMWSMAIWDKHEKSLFISRDRMGQKPFYFCIKDNGFYFSSEIKPLLPLFKNVNANKLALSEYLAIGSYDHLYEETFFEEISQLKASHFAIIKKPTLELRVNAISYWQIKETKYKERIPLTVDTSKEFRLLMENAVSSQLLSDVPLGATLSGGLDSSIIVSIIANKGVKDFPVFTAQFPGSKHDETLFVNDIKEKYSKDINIIFTPVNELSLKNELETTIFIQEEPFGDASIMAHKYLVRAAKENNVKVLLGGQGGDEVSMGYSWMYERVYSNALRNKDIKTFFNFLIESKLPINTAFRLIISAFLPNLEKSLRLKNRFELKNWLYKNLRINTSFDYFSVSSDFIGIYKESLATVGLPHLTHYDDRSTMHYSIEGRMPFLDHRLFEFTSKLHPECFFKNGYSKELFRKAFSDILPVSIIQRKDKVGFYTPISNLIYKDANWVKKVLTENIDILNKLVSENFKNDILDYIDKGELPVNKALKVFRLLSVIIWAKKFSVNI